MVWGCVIFIFPMEIVHSGVLFCTVSWLYVEGLNIEVCYNFIALTKCFYNMNEVDLGEIIFLFEMRCNELDGGHGFPGLRRQRQ